MSLNYIEKSHRSLVGSSEDQQRMLPQQCKHHYLARIIDHPIHLTKWRSLQIVYPIYSKLVNEVNRYRNYRIVSKNKLVCNCLGLFSSSLCSSFHTRLLELTLLVEPNDWWPRTNCTSLQWWLTSCHNFAMCIEVG